ncbi:MAG: lysostaphin resistance A-like protein [Mycobacterium leprae]
MAATTIGAFGPLLAAATMIVPRAGWSGVKKHIGQAFDLRVKARYYVLAVLLPLITTAGTHYIANWTALDSLPSTFLPDTLPVWAIGLISIPYFLAMLVLGGGQEEFGWRGYAQEPLQERFGVIRGSLLLGLVWSLWHLPLWVLPGDGHADYPFVAFMFFTISLSLILGCLYNMSGKKLVIPLVVHAMSNTLVPFFPVLHMAKVAQPGYWLWAGLTALVALCLSLWFWRSQKAGHSFESNEREPLPRGQAV